MRRCLSLLIFLPLVMTLQVTIAPYPTAPACVDHDTHVYHALWNATLGCHYDHEHGQDPFTQTVTDTFPDFDLYVLLGRVGVGHTNPSSEHENTLKHGGMKWDVTLNHSAGCSGGLQAPTGVNALVIQYHTFGNYAVEFEARVHSAVGLLRQCQVGNPTDYGYVFINQFQDYGQRITPYQGAVLTYSDTPQPAYPSQLSPYLSVDCFSGGVPQCRSSRQFILDKNANASSTWVSRPQAAPIGSSLFAILFRARDAYQVLDYTDLAYPFTFAWLCSSDSGATYAALTGCRYNNSTTRIHEVHGEIPAAWDNLAGFDTDARAGRITAEGYLTAFGNLNSACLAPGLDCHPIKLFQAFTGKYLSLFALVAGKASFAKENLPERDLYFCAGLVCAEGAPGAAASGWVGAEN